MVDKKPIFKAKIIEIPKRFCVSIPDERGYNKHYDVESLEEAKEISKQKEKEFSERWEENNNEEKKRIDADKNLRKQINNYTCHLKKQLWHDARDYSISNQEKKGILDTKKEILKTLSGLLNGTLVVVYHTSYFNDSTYYSIQKGDEE